MENKDFIRALEKVKNSSKKNFKQTYDLIINLRDLNLKKPEEKVDDFLVLRYSNGKKRRICGLVGYELSKEAKENFDSVVFKDEFEKYKDKKLIKKLAGKTDFFVAQANLMVDVAKIFGRTLGPLGKMPNPKAGCVIGPNANLKVLREKLDKTIRLQTKNELIVRASIGKEEMDDKEILDNLNSVYSYLLNHLPKGKNNIKSVLLKLTMGPTILVGKEELKENGKKIKKVKREEVKEEIKSEAEGKND